MFLRIAKLLLRLAQALPRRKQRLKPQKQKPKAQLVLQKGKNPWRSKENRSKKLDTFLRLKGVHF